MKLFILLVAFVTFIQGYGAQQIQMPEAGSLMLPDDDLASQVKALQKNVTDLWSYIYELRGALSQHLNHLRQHQMELESTVHSLSHKHEGMSDASHTDGHHHSGEHHHHSGEHHSHSDSDHSHDSHHSHSGEQHSHGDEQHSHGDEHHSHSGEHHSHSGEHSHGVEGAEGSHSHHHHGDSHEKSEDLQQSVQGVNSASEPLVVATRAPSHHGHHQHQHGSHGATSSADNGMFKPLPMISHHHYHHNANIEHERNRARTVVLPKYSEYDLYDFAVCNVQPNRAIPEDEQQEIVGQISLWQKKIGGPLNLHVRLQGFNVGGHHHGQEQQHHGHQDHQEEQDNETPAAAVGHKHGFHVHSLGDLSNGCQSTGPHFNPKSVKHGGPNALVRHVGDLGNIECDEHGITNIVFSDDVASLQGQYSIIGKSLVIHSNADDYGLGGNDESSRTGNAGTRIACCLIVKVDKLPIRLYKAVKTAAQYQN